MKEFADNKAIATIYLQPEIRQIIEAVAEQDKLLSAGKRLNVSGAIKKIIVEWQQLTGFQAPQ